VVLARQLEMTGEDLDSLRSMMFLMMSRNFWALCSLKFSIDDTSIRQSSMPFSKQAWVFLVSLV